MNANGEIVADTVDSKQLSPDEDKQRSQLTSRTLEELQDVREDADGQRLQSKHVTMTGTRSISDVAD